MSDYSRRKSWVKRNECQKCEQEAVKNIEVEKDIKKHIDKSMWCKDCEHEWGVK